MYRNARLAQLLAEHLLVMYLHLRELLEDRLALGILLRLGQQPVDRDPVDFGLEVRLPAPNLLSVNRLRRLFSRHRSLPSLIFHHPSPIFQTLHLAPRPALNPPHPHLPPSVPHLPDVTRGSTPRPQSTPPAPSGTPPPPTPGKRPHPRSPPAPPAALTAENARSPPP